MIYRYVVGAVLIFIGLESTVDIFTAEQIMGITFLIMGIAIIIAEASKVPK